jgi:acetyl esterase/lipase
MVSIDYRLAPDSVFPAQLLDVRAALRWIRVNSLEYGLNPDSVGLWGASSGGHLAALAGLMASIHTLPEESETAGVPAAVHAVVTGYAPIDLMDSFPSATSRESIEAFLGEPPEERPDLARQASPIFHVNSAAPPFLILQGTADEIVPTSHAEALFEAISAANHEATLYLIEGFGHGFFEPSSGQDADDPAGTAPPRLQAEPDAPAVVRVKRHRHREEKMTDLHASFDSVRDFFVSTLKHNPAAQ